ncbi:hypothetical protein TGAM01_v202040 [Trichoderma gamsii]|uniref:Uncharacterized protein n=1 Tax=Trichoderma gamsii TaxID=398673 RepID=A0A2P4ZXB2_9HYPO|nr:hypothetical protein TGAM01_v202040 [Trichoderma gamsii]PON28932.1 hypothetical protein TGAM01_v202040 [Trichoderma gamsii]
MDQRSDLLQAASDGNLRVFQELTEDEDIDYYKDQDGNTLLSIAARKGHTDLVKLLLAKDARPSIRNPEGKTPLDCAAENGYKEIVELLLNDKNFFNSEFREAVSETVLSAAAGGHVSLLKHLIQTYSYDLQHEQAQMMFHRAAASGHKEIVKLLLGGYNIEINGTDDSGNTALYLAVQACREDVVRVLLERQDIDIHAYSTGGSAFSAALDLGRDDLAEMLYASDRAGRINGQGALYHATKKDDTKTVKWLLSKDEVDFNATISPSLYYTPLHLASRKDCTETAKLLLARNDIMVNIKDSLGNTPLHKAAYKGHREMVKLLLARNDIDINAENNSKETPLHMAVSNGHAETVRLLLENNGAKGCIITSLLSVAAKKGYTKITQLLLTRIESGINSEIDGSKTLLHIAAENDHRDMVKWLLEADGINVNAKTSDDKTPLFLALQNEHEFITELLITSDDLDLKATEFRSGYLINQAAEMRWHDVMNHELARECNEYPSRTPLTRYSENAYFEALKYLLERDDIDVNSMDSEGRTPLSRAAEKGHEEVVAMLLHYCADCNFKDSDGRTPLAWAAENEHKGIAEQLVPHDTATLLLLTREGNKRAIDFILCYKPLSLEEKDDYGQTALHLAVSLGHQDIARALMLQGVDVNSKDDKEKTPLQLSMQRRHGDVIQGLLAFKANPEGITAEEWRKAFKKQSEDMILLSRGLDGEHYVNFPTTILTGDAQLQMSAKIKSHL